MPMSPSPKYSPVPLPPSRFSSSMAASRARSSVDSPSSAAARAVRGSVCSGFGSLVQALVQAGCWPDVTAWGDGSLRRCSSGMGFRRAQLTAQLGSASRRVSPEHPCDRHLHHTRAQVAVSLPHVFRLVADDLVDDPLVNALAGQRNFSKPVTSNGASQYLSQKPLKTGRKARKLWEQ